MREIAEIYVHCAYTSPDMDIGRAEIDGWHRANGWNGIGYHYVIRRDGTQEAGRPEGTIGAHVRGHNDTSLGVCLVGGKSPDTNRPDFNFTRAQLRALEALLNELTSKYPAAVIKGHRDTDAAKACPCFDVAAWWEGN